jgi:hypothetical protein
MGREEGHAWSWWGNLKERDDVENLAADGSITSHLVFKKWVGEARIGFIWLRIGSCNGPL